MVWYPIFLTKRLQPFETSVLFQYLTTNTKLRLSFPDDPILRVICQYIRVHLREAAVTQTVTGLIRIPHLVTLCHNNL